MTSKINRGDHGAFFRPVTGAGGLKVLICAALTLTTLAFAATPAFAEKIYYPGVSFGEPGSGPGQFKAPVGVAANDATGLEAGEGDVYVVDSGNDRVERFSSSGVYLGQFNGSGTYEVEGKEVKHGAAAPSGAFQEPEQIAVDNCTNQLLGTTCTTAEDPSVGDVYVTDKGNKVVDKFSATGEYVGQLTEMKVCQHGSAPCEVAPFSQLGGLAVDSAGNLWVEEAFPEYEPIENKHFLWSHTDEFSGSGVPERAVGMGDKEFGRGGIVVEPNGDFDVISFDGQLVHAEVEVFEVAGEAREGFSNGSIGLGYGTTALAIVPSTSSQLAGDVLADYGGSSLLYAPITEREQQPLEAFPGETVPKGYEGLSGSDGLAVNASATVYASERGADRIEIFNYSPVPKVITEPSSGVSETALTLHGSVNPGGEAITECYFQYGTEAGNYTGGTVACKQTPGAVNKSVPVEAELSELAPAQARSFRLVAVNKAGIAKDGGGITITRPVIAAEEALEVGFEAASVRARVEGGGLSASTCWRIEYGTSVAYGGSTSLQCAAPGEEEATASVELTGLQPSREYHFRVVARNALGEEDGADATFTTFGLGAGELPDGRVYEAVSPLGAGGFGSVYVPDGMLGSLDELDRHGISTNDPFQVAAGGEAVSYAGDPSPRGGNGNEGHGGGNVYVARRSPGGGWTQADVNASGYANEAVGFSGDLSAQALTTSGEEELGAGAPEGYPDLYRRAVGWSAAGEGPFEAALGSFEALSSATPPCPAKEFGYVLNGKLKNGLGFAGGNTGTGVVAPYSHSLFESDAGLPSTPAAPAGCGAGNDLYDSLGGRLYLVNVLPNGSVEQDATFGRQGPSTNGVISPEFSGAISADGSRIYWSAAGKALYVRLNDTEPESAIEEGRCTEPAKACTLQTDQVEPGVSGGHSGGGQFWSANEDGSRALFTDENKLTPDSAAVGGGAGTV